MSAGISDARPKPGTGPLKDWIERQFRFSADAMLRSISATSLVKHRSGFRQTIVPKPGSILASPIPSSYDPDPDYFFHWFRDAAVVIEALRTLIEERAIGPIGLERFREFLEFNEGLRSLKGSAYFDGTRPRPTAMADFQQFLRPESELRLVGGTVVLAETRVNPDGTLDFIRWNRPQTDGSALRALALLRSWPMAAMGSPALRSSMRGLIKDDLELISNTWREPTFDIWEEASGAHYYTRRVQAAALAAGADWERREGRSRQSDLYAAAAEEISAALDSHWSDDLGVYQSETSADDQPPRRTLDIATVLGVLHAGAIHGPHSILDPRMQATLARLEDLFDAELPINNQRPATRAPALGRYAGDVYYGGGGFYFSTLAAAEFYFRLADAIATPADRLELSEPFLRRVLDPAEAAMGPVQSWSPAAGRELGLAMLRRGDLSLETVRAFTPESGELSEQFDRSTGAQTSAKNLTWSYAAFITAIAARRRALRRLQT